MEQRFDLEWLYESLLSFLLRLNHLFQKIFPKAVELIRATKAVACKDESDQKTKSQGDFSHELDDNPDTLKVIEDFFAKVEDYKLDEFERNLFENQIVRLSSNKI